MTWVCTTADGAVINVRVVPRASRSEVAGEMGDALKIRLQAPPVEGKANKALVEFLAEALDIPRRNVEILSGESNRNKRVLIRGLTERAARERLKIEN